MKLFKKIELRINGIYPELVIPFNNFKEVSDELQELVDKKEVVVVKIEEFKSKRTLNQNRLYWKLVNKIARTIDASDTEVHIQMLRDYGTLKGVYEVLGGEINERYADKIEKNIYAVYKGSSDMDTKEFNKLIDGVIYEAKELGLEISEYERI